MSLAQLANQLDILLPGDRPFVVPSAFIQARQKLAFDQAARQASPADRHTLASAVSHPPGAGLQPLAVDGVVWRTPDTRTMPAPFKQVENRPGETQYPQVRVCCVRWELTSHLADPDSDGLLCGKRDGVGRATD